MSQMPDCELCREAGGTIVFQHAKLRVVQINDALHPGFFRVIWQSHEREMTDLSQQDRMLFMSVVWETEQAVRSVLRPQKINLASLGNLTPHLHWHVIARFAEDAHFPQPVWGAQQRDADLGRLHAISLLLPQVREMIALKCGAL